MKIWHKKRALSHTSELPLGKKVFLVHLIDTNFTLKGWWIQ